MDKKIIEQINFGWIHSISIFVMAPLFYYYVVVPITDYFKGNRSVLVYVDKYIANSDTINLIIPSDRETGFSKGDETFRVKTIKGSDRRHRGTEKTLCAHIYYIESYKKYFEIITFDGIDKYGTWDIGKVRRFEIDGHFIIVIIPRPPMEISVYVNRTQWNDKSYGTKENPMPVFVNRFVSGDVIELENEKGKAFNESLPPGSKFARAEILPDDIIYKLRNAIPQTELKLYVENYLRYILPKKEFKRLFENK